MVEITAVSPPRTSRRFNLVSAALAFVLWGAWAWHVGSRVSSDANQVSPLVSALAQGTGSFINVMVMVRCVAWLYNRFPLNLARLTLPPTITVAAMSVWLGAAHALVGTVHILQTITPGLIVAFFFCVYTTFKLHGQTHPR